MGVYAYVELYVVPDSIENLSGWKNLRIPFTIHCPHSAHGFNLAKPELRAHNRRIFSEVRAFADGLNADYIVIHGGIDGEAVETARQLKNLGEKRALIENKPYKSVPAVMKDKICVGYSKKELELIKAESDCGFCLDFVHGICAANSLKIDHNGYLKDLMSLEPVMFHLTDMTDVHSEIDSHQNLGSGTLDILKMKDFLSESSKITFETPKNSKNSLSDFEKDINFFYNLKRIP